MSSYATVDIAGVDLVDGAVACKALIIDGAAAMPDHIGVNRFSAAGNVFTQVLAVATGAKFGIRAEFLPASVLSAIVAAVNSAMNGGAGSFNVTASDESITINATVAPDYEAGWVQFDGNQRMDARAIKGIVFRFVVVA